LGCAEHSIREPFTFSKRFANAFRSPTIGASRRRRAGERAALPAAAATRAGVSGAAVGAGCAQGW
jgi:hypothetical protein